MTFLFYGPDDFRINLKIKEIIEEYHKKYPNIEVCRTNSPESLKEDLKKLYLFAPKRLFVVLDKSIGDSKKSEVYLNLIKDFKASSDANTFIIFIFDKLDLKNKFFNYLTENGKSQFFGKLSSNQLKRHIVDDLAKAGFKIAPLAAEKLVFLCDNSLDLILNELEKTKIYKQGAGIINEEDLLNLCAGSTLDINIFNLIDAFNARDKKKIFFLFEKHYLNNENNDEAFYQILSQLKKIIMVKSLLEEKKSNSASIATSKLSLHPFVFKKIMANISRFSYNDLRNMILKFFELDKKIKSGRFKSADLLPRLLMDL